MTREGSVRNRPTELVGRHMRLTREAQILLVAETMAQVRPLDEVPTTCVLGGVEAYASRTQKDWYHKELARALKVGRQAAKAQAQLEVLAAPERHTQPEQRHMAVAAVDGVTLASQDLYLKDLNLPVAADVVYTYSRPRGGREAWGVFHIVLDAPLTHGRLRREAGETLCGKTAHPSAERGSHHEVTCTQCVKLAARFDGPHQQVQQQQAALERHAQPEPQSAREEGFALRARYGEWVLAQNGGRPPICADCGQEIVPEEATQGSDDRFYCGYCWGALCDEAANEQPNGPREQVQQQAQAAAPVLIAEIDPECDRCGALLDELGSCPRCTPLRISAATTDLAGLLRGNGWGEERRELATETADGKITLRTLPSGDVRLEVDRYGAAVAAVTLTREARLALVTDLMQLDRAQAWGGQ